jgi:signal peptidase
MSPAINAGDIIISSPVNDNLSVGKIVTFMHNQTLVTHRIIDIREGKIQTQGDANDDPDPSLIPLDQIQGVFLFDIPYLGYISSFTGTRTGWLLTIILPVSLLVIWIVIEILREAFRSPAKKDSISSAENSHPAYSKCFRSLSSCVHDWLECFSLLFSNNKCRKLPIHTNKSFIKINTPSEKADKDIPLKEVVDSLSIHLNEHLKENF